VNHTDIETPGAHTWMVWRRNLAEQAGCCFDDRNIDARTQRSDASTMDMLALLFYFSGSSIT